MFHIQPEEGHYQAPKHIVVLYVINYIYIYPPDICVTVDTLQSSLEYLSVELLAWAECKVRRSKEFAQVRGCGRDGSNKTEFLNVVGGYEKKTRKMVPVTVEWS